jgi:hypothetical protein
MSRSDEIAAKTSRPSRRAVLDTVPLRESFSFDAHYARMLPLLG